MKNTGIIVCILLIALISSFKVLPAYGAASLSTNRPSYNPGYSVTISGSGFPANVKVSITVTPFAYGWVGEATTDSQGHFTASFTLRPDAAYGTYTVSASAQGVRASCTFTVPIYVGPPPSQPPTPPPTPAPKNASSISISASKYNASLAENVTISGSLNPALTNEKITLKITDPSGRVEVDVRTAQGNFRHVLTMENPGICYVEASWPGNDKYLASTSSRISINVVQRTNLSLIVAPRVLGLNDTMILYIASEPLLSSRYLDIYFTYNSSDWNELGSVLTSSGGWAVFLTHPNKVGTYSYKIKWAGEAFYYPSESNEVNATVFIKMTAEDILRAIGQVNELTIALASAESELNETRAVVADLQGQVSTLQGELNSARAEASDLQSRLSQALSELANAQFNLILYPIIALIVGIVMGLIVSYLLLKRRGS